MTPDIKTPQSTDLHQCLSGDDWPEYYAAMYRLASKMELAAINLNNEVKRLNTDLERERCITERLTRQFAEKDAFIMQRLNTVMSIIETAKSPIT